GNARSLSASSSEPSPRTCPSESGGMAEPDANVRGNRCGHCRTPGMRTALFAPMVGLSGNSSLARSLFSASAAIEAENKETSRRTIQQLGAAVLLAAGFAFAVPSSVLADTSVTIEKEHKHHYVYYGDHEIYFAPETKVYYWRSGDRWISGATLPEEDRAYVTSGGFEIDLDTDKP